MICPACQTLFEPLRVVRDVTICRNCLASLVVSTGLRATEVDILGTLTLDEVKSLKGLRAELRKAKGAQ